MKNPLASRMPFEVRFRANPCSPYRVLARAITRENAQNYQRAYQRVMRLGFIYIFEIED